MRHELERSGCSELLDKSERDGFAPDSLRDEKSSSRMPALGCALALLFCVLVCHPIAEIGISDDWSYIKSAQVLAQTGHVVYNGWATAMVGWQLFLGALFAKLFGSSFTAIRTSTMLVALATAFLTQRTLVRTGINSRNATIGTLALVLSPLFLPLAVTFMTDIGGLFCIVLCLYACLRALQAGCERTQLAWLAFAALSNTLLGTARQIAWLGALIMVPSTVWLLRRRPHVVFAGILLYTFSVMCIFCAFRWFSHQPYSQPEPLIPGPLGRSLLYQIGLHLCTSFFEWAMFLLPILIVFAAGISFHDRRTRDLLILGGAFCVIAGFFVCIFDPSSLGALIAPYAGDFVTQNGLVDGAPILGVRPLVLTPLLRTILTAAVLFGLNCFVVFALSKSQIARFDDRPSPNSWSNLLVLVVPYLLGYLTLLVPRSSQSFLFDRYLLPLLFVGSVLLLRFFQDWVQPKLPSASIAITLFYAAYAVTGTHDAFALYRAKAAAIAELRLAGIPDASIDGGFEHNGMTQIDRFGYMNDPRIRVPVKVYVPYKSPFPDECEPYLAPLTPAVVPGYSLSFDPAACGGPSGFAPVSYYNWLGLRTVSLYIVRTVKALPKIQARRAS